jgi:hypothetical protein
MPQYRQKELSPNLYILSTVRETWSSRAEKLIARWADAWGRNGLTNATVAGDDDDDDDDDIRIVGL